MDTKYTEVYPYGCDAEECDYKKQRLDAGKPFRIPEQVAFGKEYMPLVSDSIQKKLMEQTVKQEITFSLCWF